jgi:hypothetical protein
MYSECSFSSFKRCLFPFCTALFTLEGTHVEAIMTHSTPYDSKRFHTISYDKTSSQEEITFHVLSELLEPFRTLLVTATTSLCLSNGAHFVQTLGMSEMSGDFCDLYMCSFCSSFCTWVLLKSTVGLVPVTFKLFQMPLFYRQKEEGAQKEQEKNLDSTISKPKKEAETLESEKEREKNREKVAKSSNE